MRSGMRPIAIGKFRKPEKPTTRAVEIVPLRRLTEPNQQSEWDTALARRAIAVRRWRGLSCLNIKLNPEP